MDQINPQQMPPTNSSMPETKSKLPMIAGVIAAVAAIGGYAAYVAKSPEKNMEPESLSKQNLPTVPENEESINDVETISEQEAGTTPSAKMAPAVIPTGASYKDGSYEADGSYQSPAGPEKIHLSVTLKDGKITDTSFTGTSEAPKSQMYMSNFSKNYKSLVIGKKIDEIKLTQVSGSSLTPMGFQDALAKIAGEAKM